jgi:hypothetical protein
MIWLLILGLYLTLFGLGLSIDIRLCFLLKDKHSWFSIPITSPIIGVLIIIDKIKQRGK